MLFSLSIEIFGCIAFDEGINVAISTSFKGFGCCTETTRKFFTHFSVLGTQVNIKRMFLYQFYSAFKTFDGVLEILLEFRLVSPRGTRTCLISVGKRGARECELTEETQRICMRPSAALGDLLGLCTARGPQYSEHCEKISACVPSRNFNSNCVLLLARLEHCSRFLQIAPK